MSNTLFDKFLIDGGYMVGGRDRKGRPIVWIKRSKSVFNIQDGSPQESAYIRSAMYAFQLGMLRVFPQLVRLVIDVSETKLLDFNFRASGKMLQLFKTHNPACTELICPCGARPIFPAAIRKAFQAMVGIKRMAHVQLLTSKDEMLSIVKDKNEIPA
jgi:CRAL/TRIO domain